MQGNQKTNGSARVQVVQGVEHLPGDVAHNIKRDASVFKVLYQCEKVVSQHFKHHAYVAAMWTRVSKGVE
jgi:hypothetical protein